MNLSNHDDLIDDHMELLNMPSMEDVRPSLRNARNHIQLDPMQSLNYTPTGSQGEDNTSHV